MDMSAPLQVQIINEAPLWRRNDTGLCLGLYGEPQKFRLYFLQATPKKGNDAAKPDNQISRSGH